MAVLETIDVHCVEDFLPHMPTVTGRLAHAQRLARRLVTPRGRFKFWPNFGTDMRQFINSKTPASAIARAAAAECLKDEQTESVTVEVLPLDGATGFTLQIEVTDAEGPFTFTMPISQAKILLIELQKAA